MPPRATPALHRALDFLESLRLDGARRGGRLPTVEEMSRRAGVALRTMHRAVRAAADRGVVVASRGSGVRWADTAASVFGEGHDGSCRGRRGTRLADEIEVGLLQGAVSDPLPTVKVLRGRFQAGYDAVRRALHELSARGVIVRRGRAWVMTRSESRRAASGLALLASGPDMATYASHGPKPEEFCTVLERVCSTRGMALHFQSLFGRIIPDPTLLGYLVVAGHNPTVQAEVERTIRPARRPVVFVDVVGDCPVPSVHRPRQIGFVGIQGARAAARQVALHLRQLGHRRIAFVSAYRPGVMEWVGDRLGGLRDVYGDDVQVFVSTELEDIETVRQHVAARVFPGVVRSLGTLARRVDATCSLGDDTWLRDLVVPAIGIRYAESRLAPLLDRALSDRDITALVGANDSVALAILRYCERNRVRVPARVSVVGFDGTRPGVLAGLASFDYNTPAFVNAALELILRPASTWPGEIRRVDIPGVVLQRATLAGPGGRQRGSRTVG